MWDSVLTKLGHSALVLTSTRFCCLHNKVKVRRLVSHKEAKNFERLTYQKQTIQSCCWGFNKK